MWQRWMIVHKVVLKTVLPVIKFLPHKLSHAWLGAMGQLDLLVIPNQDKNYRAAVADTAGRIGADWDVPSLARNLSRQTYRWRVRDLLFDGQADAKVERWFDVKGKEHLDEAMARGKGVILLANHFGAHVMTSHWMFRHGYPLRWFSERPRNVSKFLKGNLSGDGPLGQSRMFISRRQTATEAAASILRTSRGLTSGLVVKVACDVRWGGPHTTNATFLGRESSFSKTWVLLAAMSGASVVPVFCQADEKGRFHLEFEEPYTIPSEAANTAQGDWWVQNALNAVEERVRLNPEQSNDYFFWSEEDMHKVA